MAESVFADKATAPTDEQLAAALGQALPWWDAAAAVPQAAGEWKFYTKAAGWVRVVKLGKRTLFYLMPKAGWFRVTFVYGERAVEAAKTAGLPPQVLQALLRAKAYMEGRSVVVDVKTAGDVETVKKMLAIKLEN